MDPREEPEHEQEESCPTDDLGEGHAPSVPLNDHHPYSYHEHVPRSLSEHLAPTHVPSFDRSTPMGSGVDRTWQRSASFAGYHPTTRSSRPLSRPSSAQMNNIDAWQESRNLTSMYANTSQSGPGAISSRALASPLYYGGDHWGVHASDFDHGDGAPTAQHIREWIRAIPRTHPYYRPVSGELSQSATGSQAINSPTSSEASGSMHSVSSRQQPNTHSPAGITGELTPDLGMFSPPPVTTQEWVENLNLPLGQLPLNNILSTGPVVFHPLIQAHSRKLVRKQKYYMHFFILEEPSKRITCFIQHPNGERCKASYASGSTTRNLELHFRSKHMKESQAIDLFRTYQMGQREQLQNLSNADIDNGDNNTYAGTPGRKGRTISKRKLKRKASRSLSSVRLPGTSAEKTQELSLSLTLALAVSQVPLTFLKNPYFLKFAGKLNSDFKMPGLGPIQKVLDDYVPRKTKQVRTALENVGYGSLTADTWTGKDSRKVLGITFHYLDETFKLQSLNLCIAPLQEDQTSNYLQQCMEETLDRWAIREKIICSTSDQGGNMEKAATDQGKTVGGSWLPCAAHNIQLCAADALRLTPGADVLFDKCNVLSSLVRDTSGLSHILTKEQVSDLSDLSDIGGPSDALPVTQTRWTSKYAMATRLIRLLPALRQAEEKLSASTAKEDKTYLAILRGALITDEEVSTLKEVLDVLDPVVIFTNQVSREKTSTLSQIYPSIFDMVNRPRKPSTVDATALQANLVEQVQRRWPMDDIPHVALVSTLLNPAAASHEMFSRSGPGTLLDSAKEQVFATFVRMAQNSCLLRGDPRVKLYDLDTESFHEDIRFDIDRYLSDVSKYKVEYVEYFDRPEDWWNKRGARFALLRALARAVLHIQASSVASERLFDCAGNLLTAKRPNISHSLFCQLLFVRNMERDNPDEMAATVDSDADGDLDSADN